MDKGYKTPLILEDDVLYLSNQYTNEEFEQAKTRGFQLEQIPIAIDGIALYAL